jgi:hypothetical protein
MTPSSVIQDLAIQFAVDLFIIVYVGFFAGHAAQRVADPTERLGWLLLIVGLNVFGATLYLLTKYRKFKAVGKGSWVFAKHWKWSSKEGRDFFRLSEAEKSQPIL